MTEKPLPVRASQLKATRRRILSAAVTSLIKDGVSATTTVAVQQRAGVSRGALLHHFPTHAELLAATVDELVRRNEDAVNKALAGLVGNADPVDRAMRVLADAFAQPAYLAELELWAVARTDPPLRAALQAAERRARRDFDRVVNDLFVSLQERPAYPTVVMLSSEFVRGFALSSVLRRDPVRRAQLLESWIWAVRILLDRDSAPILPRPQETPADD